MDIRSWEHVKESADAAGVSTENGTIQVLRFSNSLMSEDFKLLELPSGVLESFQNGERIIIRGEVQEDAVLCTEHETFDLKLADQSNTMLLSTNTVFPKTEEFTTAENLRDCEIRGCVSNYYELRLRRPKLQKLKKLLEETAYQGEIYEKQINESNVTMYTMEDLREKIQASETELRNGLQKLDALQIDGNWRIFEAEYRERIVNSIVNLLDENSWSYDRVPIKETCNVLEELYPRFVISHCLQCYGEPLSMETDEAVGEVYYKLSEAKICSFFAEFLLRPAGRFHYQEFMDTWKQSVPDGMHADEEYLKGIALVDMTTTPPVIWHFPSDNLPSDPAVRFNKLFKTRAKWTFEDIRPYLTTY
ncbi:sister chromatid cohesion protein DCC1-like isoform X2 [Xenia sp. Carnegie-2017]|uniref:sister chromatid cohesion protein DCC1-like isoform X2 n=1 Tax=Xenia sp. Carnegie-2017 TaxID=2897299 RepID=UPI001F042AC0|nr:sister chromatid cohesion protein DCC1-like isoform X2 [Xenia sp. Carnegie-2017]